ncbi:probable serine/threonine-protein kinase PIX13 [Euphorbia lathyris]|uniref:probable serine/threonine-protein kinase PIX13 n=1 Tax=Euphorbia lathyris TaxID=212925 RepID=UPI003313A24D
MGNWCSCFATESKPQSPEPPPPPPAEPIPDPDLVPSSVVNLIDGDTSFLGSNVSGNSWFSMATNVTTLLSQASGAIAAFWGNNPPEDNEFSVAMGDENLPDGGTASDSKFRAFTFAQLKAATSNFRSDMELGRGGFGGVYKGWIKEKMPSQGTRKSPIAVKRLDANSKQGFRQWRTEVGFLARLSHPNIVKLLGYCKENENFVIVYEFMQKGSLNYHLFGRKSDRFLPWNVRVKIMIGMAEGLSYLHMMEKPIIYRDFKTSNVLLDESYNAKISDFGLAKWGPADGNSYVTGHVMGTMGYTAPEYIKTGNLYVKSDVYSFGVVLIEMLTGMRAIDINRPTHQRNLLEWVKPCLCNRRRLRNIMDGRLEGKYSPKEAKKIAELAARCVEPYPSRRPSMEQVADILKDIGAPYI